MVYTNGTDMTKSIQLYLSSLNPFKWCTTLYHIVFIFHIAWFT